MYILAYKDGHDPAACLMRDGVIVAAAEEERFTRKKHAPSAFPKHAIQFCLSYAGIREEEVNHVVYARLNPLRTMFAVFGYYLRRPPRTRLEFRYCVVHLRVQIRGVFGAMGRRKGWKRIMQEFPRLPRPVAPFDHHLCHAASTYLFSGFSDALVITWDGKGEATSVTYGRGKNATLTILQRRGVFESLGLLYSAATSYLGFTANDGEYKVMGLAPYARGRDSFAGILDPDKKRGYRMNSDFALFPFSQNVYVKRFGSARAREAPMSAVYENFAAGLQYALEEAGLSFARMAHRAVSAPALCIAGGVALNVKLNKILWESGLWKDMFVQPAAGDQGLVLGAAGLMHTRVTGSRPEPLRHVYLGTSYSDEEIRAVFEKRGVVFRVVDPAEEGAKHIAAGEVVAWFQGRMEFGPRALGSRSILAHPGIVDIRDRINEKIKFREEFRPFCPSILSEHAPRLLKHYLRSPFMAMSFEAGDEARSLMPAVVHVDGTVRPQEVDGRDNPVYRALIERVYAQTGVPAVLNTSLNIRGEPIVESPEDLVNFFIKTNVDCVIAGNIMALRSEQPTSLFAVLQRETLKTEY